MSHTPAARTIGTQRPMLVAILLLFGLGMLANTSPAQAQGCTQCRDSTAATPPQTQAAYRHAILLLAGVAAVLFGGTLVLIKRNR